MYRNGEGWLNLHANHKMRFLQIELIRVSGHYIPLFGCCISSIITMWGPQLQVGNPENYGYIRTTNHSHSYWSSWHQLSYHKSL